MAPHSEGAQLRRADIQKTIKYKKGGSETRPLCYAFTGHSMLRLTDDY